MICQLFFNTDTFPIALQVKNLPAMQEMQVPPPDEKDPLEEEMATHSSNFFSVLFFFSVSFFFKLIYLF